MKPLTLEELRKMDGKPVWGKSLINNKPGEWFIVRIVEMSKSWFIACAGSSQGFGDKCTYGKTWVAYLAKPPGQMTNADRIRAMTDEELSYFLCDFRTGSAGEHHCDGCKAEEYCRTGHNGMIDWLQQPAKED